MSDLPGTAGEISRLADNDEDRSKVKQYYLDTDRKRDDMQDTYSRVTYISEGNKAFLALKQIQYPSEITKIKYIINANPLLVEYLDKKGMIWYSPEELRKEQELGETSTRG